MNAISLKITGSTKGYYLEVAGKEHLHANGSITKRMDGTVGLSWDGTFLPDGDVRPAVEAMIAEVMASGIAQTITIRERAKVEAVATEWRSRRGLTLTEEMDDEDTDY